MLASRGCKVVVNDLGAGKDGAGADARAADIVVKEIEAGGGQRDPADTRADNWPLQVKLWPTMTRWRKETS